MVNTNPYDGMSAADTGRAMSHVVCRALGRGKIRGAELDLLTYNIWTVSGGTIVSCVTYDEHADALAAAGLGE
jgi:hypothetical protein